VKEDQTLVCFLYCFIHVNFDLRHSLKRQGAMAIHLSPENMLLDVTVVIYTIVYIHFHLP